VKKSKSESHGEGAKEEKKGFNRREGHRPSVSGTTQIRGTRKGICYIWSISVDV